MKPAAISSLNVHSNVHTVGAGSFQNSTNGHRQPIVESTKKRAYTETVNMRVALTPKQVRRRGHEATIEVDVAEEEPMQ